MRYGATAFYEDEKRVWAEIYKQEVTNEEAEHILRKLNRHYKLRIDIRFRVRWGGSADHYTRLISIRHQPSMGVLLHEFAHMVHSFNMFRDLPQCNHSEAHGAKFAVVMGRVVTYAKEYGYWKDELAQRRERKKKSSALLKQVVKPKVQDIRAQKIESRKKSIERCERKISYYTTLLKKARRSLAALERAQVKKQ